MGLAPLRNGELFRADRVFYRAVVKWGLPPSELWELTLPQLLCLLEQDAVLKEEYATRLGGKGGAMPILTPSDVV